ncbi:uncharacterized protein BXZ73DRAFT_96603 [Epithele typhae]|uniref:uncharacterized protein n=1 Tax=Epithele typhae TaxID=378194 RepID=UPI0020088DAE|nr:uncharacterized protein BXZ73DRAFT_96603 [Epithele typhae]KAH9944106.1 hypothetical protein BXZ73DRAFT_96603 [Epithele typhae]
MHRSAGRDFRHLSQAAYALLERTRIPPRHICIVAKPLHSTRGRLHPPAVAAKLSYSRVSTPTPEEIESSAFREDVTSAPTQEDTHLNLRPRAEQEGFQDTPSHQLLPPSEILDCLSELHGGKPAKLTLENLREVKAAYPLLTFLRHHRDASTLVLHLLDVDDTTRAFQMLKLATEVGCVFPDQFYNWAKRRLRYTTTSLLNWRLQAQLELQHYPPFENVVALFQKERVMLSRFTYHLLITMNMRNHDLSAALRVLEAMAQAGMKVTSQTWMVVLLGYRTLGLNPVLKTQAFAALEEHSADEVTSRFILVELAGLMLDAGDLDGTVQLLSLTPLISDVLSFAPGADSIAQEGAQFRLPDAVTPTYGPRGRGIKIYNRLLGHFARHGDLERAIPVLQSMRLAGVVPDVDTANALVRLYFAAGHFNDALHIVASALAGVPSSLALLSSLGYLPAAPPQYPTFAAPTPTVDLFNNLLRGILPSHGLRGLSQVLSIMKLVQIDTNSTTVTLVLQHVQRHGLAGYRPLVKMVRKLMSQGATPTLQQFHVLLAALMREEYAYTPPGGLPTLPVSKSYPTNFHGGDGPESCSDEPEELGLQTTISTLSRPRRGHLLRPILQSLGARRVRCDRASYAMRIKHDALVLGDMDLATKTLRTMVDAGMQPNLFHYGALIEGYVAAGDLDAATDTLAAAEAAGVRPDVRTHTILIAGHARLAHPAAAARAFRTMLARGIRPDVPAVDALVGAFVRARARAAARDVLLRLWPGVAGADTVPADARQLPLRQLCATFRALHPGAKGGKARRPVRSVSPATRAALSRVTDELLRSWGEAAEGGSAGC